MRGSPVVLTLLAAATAWAAPPAPRVANAVAGACARKDAAALWGLAGARFRGVLEDEARRWATSLDDAAMRAAFPSYRGSRAQFTGRAFLAAAIESKDRSLNFCLGAVAWKVVAASTGGERSTVVLRDADGSYRGVRLVRQADDWKLEDLTRAVDASGPDEAVVRIAARLVVDRCARREARLLRDMGDATFRAAWELRALEQALGSSVKAQNPCWGAAAWKPAGSAGSPTQMDVLFTDRDTQSHTLAFRLADGVWLLHRIEGPKAPPRPKPPATDAEALAGAWELKVEWKAPDAPMCRPLPAGVVLPAGLKVLARGRPDGGLRYDDPAGLRPSFFSIARCCDDSVGTIGLRFEKGPALPGASRLELTLRESGGKVEGTAELTVPVKRDAKKGLTYGCIVKGPARGTRTPLPPQPKTP